MDLNKLADILIPDENAKTPDYYEKLYPERELPKGTVLVLPPHEK